jgi:Tfp pilus assembly protein PilN
MLRINLLPPYIYEGAKRRNVLIVWVLILLLVIAGFVFGKVQIDTQTAALVAEKERLTPDADKADKLQAQANSINTESQAIREKRDFVKNARQYNSSTYQPVVYNIRDYTMKGILYYSLIPSGQTVTLDAYAGSLAQVGHYLMWMEHNPQISQVSISLSGLPSFPVPPGFNGQPPGNNPRPPKAGGYDFGVTLTLNKPIPGPPAYAPGAGGAAGGGAPAAGGGMFGGGMTAPGPMGAPMGMPGMSSGMTAPGGMTGGAPSAPMSAGMQQPGGGGGPAGGGER